MATIPKRHTYYAGVSMRDEKINGIAMDKHNVTVEMQKQQQQQQQQQHLSHRKHVSFGPYYVGSTLGEGEFGKVKLGWSKNSGEISKQVAIKLIRRDSIPKNSDKEIKVYREINALKHLTHPNIVKLEEVLQNSKYIGIVLEYASGGEFYKYIQRKRRLKESLSCRLFAQLVSGIYYMHSKGLVHRDLKLENLLLDKHENLVITDFGFVNEFTQHNELMKTSCGSPCYAAPELVVSTKPYEARKADVWSCGVILYAMLAGYLPWDDDPENPEGDDIGKLYYYITRTALKFPDYITPIPRDLLRRILVADPRKRISLRYIQKHEWLKSHTPFLSITPDEWDRTTNIREIFRSPKPQAYRSIRPHSSASTSSTSSKGEKRDSLVIDSTLITLPAPPQESQSHAIAKPSSPSQDIHYSPQRGGSQMHTRSNSAASIALQAVVDSNLNHDASGKCPSSTPSWHHMNSSQRTSTYNPAQLTSLMNRSSIIIESPTKAGTNNSAVEGTVTNFNHTYGIDADKELHTARPHRKPRPTSYHPTSHFMLPNDTVSTGTTSTFTNNRLHTPPDAASNLAEKVEQLTFESTPTLVNEVVLPSMSPQLPTDAFEKPGNLMGAPSSQEQHVAHDLSTSGQDCRLNDSKRFSVLAKQTMFSKDVSELQPTGKDQSVHVGNASEIPLRKQVVTSSDKKVERKRFSLLSFYSSYNTSKSSIDSHESKPKASHDIVADDKKSKAPLAIPTYSKVSGGSQSGLQQPKDRKEIIQANRNMNNRRSMIVSSSNERKQQAQGREQPSTARKVFDFFKRRSMRL